MHGRCMADGVATYSGMAGGGGGYLIMVEVSSSYTTLHKELVTGVASHPIHPGCMNIWFRWWRSGWGSQLP